LRARGLRRHGLGAGSLVFCTSTALAEPPAHWSVGVERLFGISHSWSSADTGGERQATTSVGIGLADLDHHGYGTARIGGDYLFELGLSLGTAFGYASYHRESDDEDSREDYWVVAPRVGWLFQLRPSLALWPRAGLTLLTPGQEPTGDHTAITLELPLVWRLPGGVIGLCAAPHLDLGFSPGHDAFFGLVSTDGTASEVGVSFGANLFF